ncbi:ribosomal protein S18-alanine N-acetyltransferase [Amnibacterium flavum]|uniref:Ribosomal-protein-alanine N-acetyltransferase n=1 Tax=Amnibacterium flavum TaxID=2173173 RepID=A0A2V1HR16_9MICO|nr:ribosomal protein S18-alanine N-acetyltransferase [Amnibacterium flavum]PVZ95056.1 ribosomal-protein-alanine N-acetyltransferase [Amnibacterium flavum]
MSWQLRRASIDDLDSIMAIEEATFPTDAWARPTMRDELAGPHGYYVVAEQLDAAHRVDGYAGLRAPAGSLEADVQTIAVAADARGRGLGRVLLLALLAEARRRHAAQVFLEVRADNDVAAALYRSAGFEPIGVRPRYYQPDDVDAVVMRHTMTEPRIAPADGTADD